MIQNENTKKLILNFEKLSFDNKKKKILNIIATINRDTEGLVAVKNAILTNPNVDGNFLDGVYTDIMSFAEAIKKGNEEKAVNHIKNMQNYIKQLHIRENQEREQENPDGILENELKNI